MLENIFNALNMKNESSQYSIDMSEIDDTGKVDEKETFIASKSAEKD